MGEKSQEKLDLKYHLRAEREVNNLLILYTGLEKQIDSMEDMVREVLQGKGNLGKKKFEMAYIICDKIQDRLPECVKAKEYIHAFESGKKPEELSQIFLKKTPELNYMEKVGLTLDDLIPMVEKGFNIELNIATKSYKRFLNDVVEKFRKDVKKPKSFVGRIIYSLQEKHQVRTFKKELVDCFFEFDNMLYVNEKEPIARESKLKRELMHEIGHFAVKKINPLFEKSIAENILLLHEGFSEYLALNFMYHECENDELKDFLWGERQKVYDEVEKCTFSSAKYDLRRSRQCYGYRFVENVAKLFKKQGVISVIRNPPSLYEIRDANLWLKNLKK